MTALEQFKTELLLFQCQSSEDWIKLEEKHRDMNSRQVLFDETQ